MTYGVTPITLSGTASSGAAVVFTIDASSTAGAGSISGNTLTVTGAGTIVIDANQAGNSNYNAATQVQQTLVVDPAGQTISFTGPSSPVTYGVTPITLKATGGASGNAVVFTIDASSTGTGSISGSTLTVTGAGNIVLHANQAGNANFNAAPSVDATLSVTALTAQERFVQALYKDELGRTGSMAELDRWVVVLNGPGGQHAVAAGIEGSPEARDRLVKSWYLTYLGRQANGSEELGWVNLLQAGQSEEQVLGDILSSAEFFNRAQGRGLAGTPEQNYVQTLYQTLLGRTGSPAEVAGWVGAFPQLERQLAALGLLHSQEYRSDVVGGYYQDLLHRPADSAGFNGWVFSSLDQASIRIGFESSDEFYTNG